MVLGRQRPLTLSLARSEGGRKTRSSLVKQGICTPSRQSLAHTKDKAADIFHMSWRAHASIEHERPHPMVVVPKHFRDGGRVGTTTTPLEVNPKRA